jgi:hypothetical protein
MEKDVLNVTVALHLVKMGQKTTGEQKTLVDLELRI